MPFFIEIYEIGAYLYYLQNDLLKSSQSNKKPTFITFPNDWSNLLNYFTFSASGPIIPSVIFEDNSANK